MDLLLAVLLILLGLLLWALSGLLPVLSLQRDAEGGSSITLQLTWMGLFVIWQQDIRSVQGARVIEDPANRGRAGLELITAKGPVALTGPYARGIAPARMAHIIDQFVDNKRIPPARLPLYGRMRLMLGFTILFPLGTVAIFIAILLLLR